MTRAIVDGPCPITTVECCRPVAGAWRLYSLYSLKHLRILARAVPQGTRLAMPQATVRAILDVSADRVAAITAPPAQPMTTVREAIIQVFEDEMARDERVFIIGEEMGEMGGPFGTTRGLIDKFGPHRLIDTPISEIGFTGLAVGASYTGLRPVVSFMCWAFALQAIDHIVNSCAKMSYMSAGRITCPIVFAGPTGKNPGYAAEHAQQFFSLYGAVPGLRVVVPYTTAEYAGLLRAAIRYDGPVVFFESELLYDRDEPGYQNDSAFVLDLGRARILREGSDLTIVGVGAALVCVEEAVGEAAGKSIEVINMVSVRPVDHETIIRSVRKTGRLIVVDDGWPCYGVASEIAARVYQELFGVLKQRVILYTGRDTHVGYSDSLERLFYPTKEKLLEIIRTAFE